MNLNGKVAIITGSGRGIGRAYAEALAHDGRTHRRFASPTVTGVGRLKQLPRCGAILLVSSCSHMASLFSKVLRMADLLANTER